MAEDNEDLSKNSDSEEFTNEKELEKYGVWVKTGPEEIDDLDESSDYDLTDLEEESIITDEEELMLGELEKELSEDNFEITENLTTITDSLDNTDLELDISELEDVELDELTNNSETPDIIIEEPKEDEIFDLDIDFDDDLNEIEELNTESSVDLSIDNNADTQNIEELENLELEDLELEDLELEDLEIDETEQPESSLTEELVEETDLDNISLDDIDDLDLDMDILLEDDESEIPDILKLDNSLEEDSDVLLIDDDSELSDFSEDLDELEEVSEPAAGNVDLSVSIPDTDIVDDFDETEKIIEDLTEFEDLDESSFSDNTEIVQRASNNSFNSQTEASEILQKIEQELLSIKNELHDVKKELSILRPDSSLENDTQKQTVPNDDPGFFEEDEDETIALTGDELDNILNTADITEETGSETESPDDFLELENVDDVFETDNLLVDGDDIIVIEDDDIITENEESNLIEEIDINEETDIDNDDLLDLEIVEEPLDEVIEEFDTPAENLNLDSIEKVIDEDILLTDLDTEDLHLDSVESSDISEDIGLDIDEIEEINLKIDQLEEDIDPVVPSEPEGTTVIDMELPEMQEESLVDISPQLKTEIKSVLSYMDQLLESLPEDKIDEFANSEHYEVYKKLFEELGLN